MECGECKWWNLCTSNCRKSTPKVFLTTSSGAGYDGEACVTTGHTITRWPTTKPDDFCGEFTPKSGKDDG